MTMDLWLTAVGFSVSFILAFLGSDQGAEERKVLFSMMSFVALIGAVGLAIAYFNAVI